MLETIIILLLKTKYNTLSLWSCERLKTYFQTNAQEICQFRTFSHFEAAITQKTLEKPG